MQFPPDRRTSEAKCPDQPNGCADGPPVSVAYHGKVAMYSLYIWYYGRDILRLLHYYYITMTILHTGIIVFIVAVVGR